MTEDEADETIDIFDQLVRERDELRAEVERLHEIAAVAQRRQEELEQDVERLTNEANDEAQLLTAQSHGIKDLLAEVARVTAALRAR